MILDEAIKHAEEVAEEKEKEACNLYGAKNYEASRECIWCAEEHRQLAEWLKDYKRLKEQEHCEDCISRQAVLDGLANIAKAKARSDAQKALMGRVMFFTEKLPSVNPQETVTEFADRCKECGKMKRCKDCKHFEYDSVANWDGIPIIVAHEICSRWGDGCKTNENGYCFLFEPKEGSEE